MADRMVQLPLGDDPPKARLLYGMDVLDGLKLLPDASVHLVCTREDPGKRLEVLREILRVLRPDGALWVDLSAGQPARSVVEAGTSEKGCCPRCGAVWRQENAGDWRPTCSCSPLRAPVRCTVLDLSGGTGTTGNAVLQLGRDYIGIEADEKLLPLAEACIFGENQAARGQEECPVIDMFGTSGDSP